MCDTTVTILNEEDTILVMGCSQDFLIDAVSKGRMQCLHVNGGHFFVLGEILEVKREMKSRWENFSEGHLPVEQATSLTPLYF